MSEKTPLHDPLADAFDSFRGDALPTFVPPGPDAVRTTVRRRRRNRTIATAACAMVVIASAGVALANFKPPADDLRPDPANSVTAPPSPSASPSTSPSASPSASASTDVRTIDWRNQPITIARTTGCTGGMVTFRNGKATHDGHTYLVEAAPVFGDIDGDGHEDALLSLKCGTAQELGRMLAGVNAGGESLGVIRGEHYLVAFSNVRISGGKVTVDATDRSQDPDVTQTRTYRWTGSALAQIGGPTSFDQQQAQDTAFEWGTATLTIPFKGAQATIQPNNRSCPRVTVTFTRVSDGQGAVQSSGCEYWIDRVGTADLDGNGTQDALVRISALRMGVGDLTEGGAWYFGYTVRDGKPVLIGFVTAANLDNPDENAPSEVKATSASASNGSARVTQVFKDQTVTRTFTWNGSRFAPDKAPPNPAADARP